MEALPFSPLRSLLFCILSVGGSAAIAQQQAGPSGMQGGAASLPFAEAATITSGTTAQRQGTTANYETTPETLASLPDAASQLLAPANPGTTVAFVDITNNSGSSPELGERVYQQLEPYLLWAGKSYGMTFIERRKLDFIMDEWKLSSFGESGDKGAQTLLGADYIITGSVLSSASGVHYTLKLVSLSNSEIVNITTGRLPPDSGMAASNSFRRPPPARPASKTAPNQAVSRDGMIRLWSDRQHYRIGGNIVFYFEVREPLYVKLVDVTPDGEKTVLFPNAYQPDGYCRPGIRYQVPPADGGFALQVSPPAGIDRVMALANHTPIAEIATRSMRGIAFTQNLVNSASSRATIAVNILGY